MTAALDDKNALVLWELAHEAGRLGDGVSGETFVRVVAPAARVDGSRPDRTVTLDAVRQAFARLRKWAEGHGLALVKVAVRDDRGLPTLPRIVFDRRGALDLAVRLRPRLSRGTTQIVAKGRRLSSSVATPRLPLSREPSGDDLLTFKCAARMLDVSVRTLERRLDGKRPPVAVVRLGARIRRVRRADIEAWIERAKRGKPARKRVARV